jgi:hypothetical protein
MAKRPLSTNYQFFQKVKKAQTNFLIRENFNLRSSVQAKLNARQI